ncbi:MAG: hypothetical protein MK096_06815 [Oleiphilaceae bacterium]|nr:hypothetical protein [Oleiphilaceae bacterium]
MVDIKNNQIGFIFEQQADIKSNRGTPLMYSGDAGVVGLVLQVATHAAVVNAMEDGTTLSIDKDVDIKLMPTLNRMSAKTLFSDLINTQGFTLKKDDEFITVQDRQNTLLIEMQPMFYASSNYKELRLQVATSLYSSNDLSQSVYKNMIEVHGYTKIALDNSEDEIANAIESSMKELVNEATALALEDAQSKLPRLTKAKTYAYSSAQGPQYSRAYYASGACNRYVIRNLRNWIISIPATKMISPKTASTCISAL